MKPISHRTLLRKSRNARNVAEYYRLENIESNRIWSTTPTEVKIPEYVKLEKPEKGRRAWGLLLALRP